MHILEFKDYEVLLTEEAMLIKPIRDLYNVDKSKYKEKFMLQASVLYHYVDPRSSYNFIIDDLERLLEIIKLEGLPKDFKIDTKLLKAIDAYKQHVNTSSLLLLEGARIAVEKVRKFLIDVDLEATDDHGKPMYTINSITLAIKVVPLLAKDLAEAERVVAKEIEEQGRARGGNENKKLFEDGI